MLLALDPQFMILGILFAGTKVLLKASVGNTQMGNSVLYINKLPIWVYKKMANRWRKFN